MSDGFPTNLLVASRIRVAAAEGVPMLLRHRGDEDSGTILLKINLLDGTAHVLTQIRWNDRLAWSRASGPDAPMADAEAERYIEQQLAFDPDLWVLEVEDRQGRPWFPGKIMEG